MYTIIVKTANKENNYAFISRAMHDVELTKVFEIDSNHKNFEIFEEVSNAIDKIKDVMTLIGDKNSIKKLNEIEEVIAYSLNVVKNITFTKTICEYKKSLEKNYEDALIILKRGLAPF